ncbi:peptidyl-prolyl cis-trans isomerase [Alteribacillus sp. JSM 102045]|uniref:peptidyl-prolyl cis-trans isomerase n=1 Tax=Alteribacillus sp. JSM 102045 TaxID=1562101 RepID=UPI0035BF7A6F
MDFIVMIHGNVQHTITIDPTVWIFDDRKIDLTSWSGEKNRKEEEMEQYKKDISKQWDKEITEGAQMPKRNQTNQVRNKKEELIKGTFGIPFESFLKNAEPPENAAKVVVETYGENETGHIASLDEAYQFVIGFSENGKPLKETGPVHVYYGDGSNKENPITHVKGFRIV